MLPDACCANCRYSRPLFGLVAESPDEVLRECHGCTPQPLTIVANDGAKARPLKVLWPTVQRADWCGSHTYDQKCLDAEQAARKAPTDAELEAAARKKWSASNER